MTVIATSPVEVAAAPTHRFHLPLGTLAIAAVSGVVVTWSLVLLVSTSRTAGGVGVALAALLALVDAAFITPTRGAVSPDHVVIGSWLRAQAFRPDDLTLRRSRSGRAYRVVPWDQPRKRLVTVGARSSAFAALVHAGVKTSSR
ncbi:MAG TPA: hypothetical protein VFR41_15235 [Acidimicrobiia bacterium]|nr:hypothetical protein [Acidimicrobiia bacterium]